MSAQGCGGDEGGPGDFDSATYLIGGWWLEGDLETWKGKAVEVMQRPENVKAVAYLADYLMLHSNIDGQLVGVLVDVSDGETSEAELAQFMALRRGWSRGCRL